MLVSLTGAAVLRGCGIFLALGVIYVLAVAIYRLFLHPLARHPGPILAKITNLYGAYHAWKGDIHVDMWRCHQKYGHCVRYAPDRLLFDTHKSLQDIYGYSSNVGKSAVYDVLVHRAPNILTCRDKTQHGRRRRLISQAFSDANLRALEPAVVTQIQKFCEKLTETPHAQDARQRTSGITGEWSAIRDMSHWCDYLAFDIMSSIVFSGQYDALGKNDFRWVLDAIGDSNVRMSVLLQASEMTFGRLDKHLFPRAIQARNKFIRLVSKMVSDRLALGKREDVQDVFSFLAKAKDPEGADALTLTELGAESTTLIVAGSDTTSTAMAAMFYYLSHGPSSYRRVTAEVRETFNSADEIRSGSKLNSCTYLRACIDETLRISPSAGSALWRQVLPGGATFDGTYIPAGYDVGAGIYAVHHNPEYYPDPTSFRPERWITGENDDLKGVHSPRVAFSPFSAGPRGCIGKGLALAELMLTMAAVIYRFDFRAVDGSGIPIEHPPGCAKDDIPEYQTRDHITAAKSGPRLQFRARF